MIYPGQDAMRLFTTGLAAGFGPCLVSCAPVLLPLIGGTTHNYRQGLASTLFFSAGRLLTYILLGLLAGWSIRYLNPVISGPTGQFLFSLASGVLLVIFGLLILLGRDTSIRYCGLFHKYFVDKRQVSMFILGILIGFTPCLPLLGVLMYIANKAANAWQGAILGGSFGLGTMVSPLLLAGMLTGAIPGLMTKRGDLQKFFNRLCGLLLILWGILLLIRR